MGARQFAVVLAVAFCLMATLGPASGVAAGSSLSQQTELRQAEFQQAELRQVEFQQAASRQTELQQVTPDTVVLDVEVYENGTAEWEVVYRTRLDDPQTTEAFRSYKADIDNNSTEYSQQFVSRMTDTIRSAENATGREMSGRNYDVQAEIREFPQRYGVVVYSFQWQGFATTSGGKLHIGDSLSGLFLNDKTRMLVSWPEAYEVTTIRPDPDEKRASSAVWTGPTDFAGNEPRIVARSPTVGPTRLPWQTLLVGVAAVVFVGAGVAGGWWMYRNRDDEDDAPPADDPPEDLLSNEERVLRLLERRGGRVKQKAVVDELGWTEAKTSQVVGSLREQGKIESFRLGRENVLALPRERHEP